VESRIRCRCIQGIVFRIIGFRNLNGNRAPSSAGSGKNDGKPNNEGDNSPKNRSVRSLRLRDVSKENKTARQNQQQNSERSKDELRPTGCMHHFGRLFQEPNRLESKFVVPLFVNRQFSDVNHAHNKKEEEVDPTVNSKPNGFPGNLPNEEDQQADREEIGRHRKIHLPARNQRL